jgi:hypothetical protein
MSLVENSPGETTLASERVLTRLFPGLSSTTKGEPAKLSITVTAVMAVISAALIPSRMLLSTGPQDDGPVFAYIGWAMKRGLMPYRDIWDHKGPLLYYLQYAGFSLSPNSTIGIGVLELIAFSIGFFFLYRVIASFASRLVGIAMAVFSVAFILHFYGGGNMTESWSLLPLAVAQYACWRWSKCTSSTWCPAVIAVCFACIFWLRANITVFPLVAIMVMLYASLKKVEESLTAVKQFALAVTAGLLLSGLAVAPLYHWGVFHDFVSAYFGYNRAYSNGLTFASRYEHTNQLLGQLFPIAIAILGTAGWALCIGEWRKNTQADSGPPSLYLRVLLLSLPFELAAATLSGRDYPHYLLPLFPTLVIFAAWFLSELEKQCKILARPALIAALLLALCALSLTTYFGDLSRSMAPTHSEYLTVARFIRRATTDTDRITVVGEPDAAFITFLARRLPASRFVYQLPLIDVNNPRAAEQREQFMCELAQNRPAVIVSGDPIMGVLCASKLNCSQPKSQPPISEYGYQSTILPVLLRDVIASQYQQVSDTRFGVFKVLIRKDLAIPTQW